MFSLENLARQYIACRRNKRNTVNALCFEARQELNLLALRDALDSRSYEPARFVCFFVKRPKLREVFAAATASCTTCWSVAWSRPGSRSFLHDSYACRKGKGVHKAVYRGRSSSCARPAPTARARPLHCTWASATISCASTRKSCSRCSRRS